MNTLLLLPKGFEITEAAAFIDVFGWNRRFGSNPAFLTICGRTEEVRGTFDVTLKAEMPVENVDPDNFAALALPGGFGEYGYYEEAYSEEFLAVIRNFNDRNKYIAAVCTGSMPLMKAGILNGKRATTYHIENNRRFSQLSESGATALKEDIVLSDNIITSCGPSTAPYVALKLLELLTSEEEARDTGRLMGYYLRKLDTIKHY